MSKYFSKKLDWNLCKKVTGKKDSEKKSGNKNFGKKVTNFWSPRTKCHWKKVLSLGIFFLQKYFLVPKFRTLFPKTFLRELFWRLPLNDVSVVLKMWCLVEQTVAFWRIFFLLLVGDVSDLWSVWVCVCVFIWVYQIRSHFYVCEAWDKSQLIIHGSWRYIHLYIYMENTTSG